MNIIDGRDAPLFAHEHLRGAINIPIGYGQFGVMAACPSQSRRRLVADVQGKYQTTSLV